ncbi:MAG: hypothetical protein K9J16_18445 [Melioribacteraceae bacterium]|nr:hypothetical protein [Melioribacteraceae bacterium]MCF8396247.1 hypothetical protein [Melioribacteraceae bacterium]MCF8421170.1 hypothetical protein [Melioribacteraceae bacterium]
MGVIKDKIIKLISEMPDDVSIDDVIEKLYFKIQVDSGLKELDEGKGIPHNKVEERMSKWLEK